MLFPEKFVADAERLLSCLYVIHCGLEIGAFKGRDLVPSHELAYFPVTKNYFNVWQVNRDEALKFLKKEITETSNPAPGWQLVTFHGNGIGWVKNIGTRLNNYLPQEYIIRMSLDNFGSDD
jgi:NOL1/NOP2/fmu family ribosome biogenesis protein